MSVNTDTKKDEVDTFFKELFPQLPQKQRKIPSPSQEIIGLAQEAAQAHHDYLQEHGCLKKRDKTTE